MQNGSVASSSLGCAAAACLPLALCRQCYLYSKTASEQLLRHLVVYIELVELCVDRKYAALGLPVVHL